MANGFNPKNLIIVGEKRFGETNGQFYIKRNNEDYFKLRSSVNEDLLAKNNRQHMLYDERYLDLLSMIIDDDGTVPVFTPDHHYISQDCEHFSKGGAIWYSQLIDWCRYFQK